jgi:uroporphyrinogen decarboxylase
MGLRFHFSAGEGPVIENPVRSSDDIRGLQTDKADELGYVAEAVTLVARHFGSKLPVIGFCGAPFTLASYMIEGGSSRQYIKTKNLMYSQPEAWDELLGKLVAVTSAYARAQVEAGADVIQVFDSWVGCLESFGSTGHLFWNRHFDAAGFNEANRSGRDWAGLANPA